MLYFLKDSSASATLLILLSVLAASITNSTVSAQTTRVVFVFLVILTPSASVIMSAATGLRSAMWVKMI